MNSNKTLQYLNKKTAQKKTRNQQLPVSKFDVRHSSNLYMAMVKIGRNGDRL
jgi:hypothetical protein